MGTNETYRPQAIRRASVEGKMVFGRMTTGTPRVVGWDVVRESDGRVVSGNFRTKAEAVRYIERRMADPDSFRRHGQS